MAALNGQNLFETLDTIVLGILVQKKDAENRTTDEVLEDTKVRGYLHHLISLDPSLDLPSVKL